MAAIYFYGRAKRRGPVRISDGKAVVQFSATRRPIGSKIDPPDQHGTTTVDHDEGVAVKLAYWHATGEEGDGVQIEDVSRFADGMKDGADRARDLGEGVLTAEAAVRKNADSKGGQVKEFRFTLRLPVDENQPLSISPVGYMLRERAFALAVVWAQHDLALAEPVEGKRTKRKGAQASLGVVGDGVPDTSEPAADAA